MIVAFGTSTPTSITVVATSTSSSPRLELRHQLAPLGRPQPPVQQPDAVALQLAAAQPLGLRLGRARDATSPTPRSAGRRRTPGGPSSRWLRRRRYASLERSSVDPRGDDRLAVRRRLRDLAHRRGRRRRSARACAGSASRSCAGRAARGPRRARWRCSTPKRCCSSTTATARSAKSTSSWISACVPTSDLRRAARLVAVVFADGAA